MKCAICYSINRWEQNCPDRGNEKKFIINKLFLHQSDFDNPNELKNLTSETQSSVLLDCGASKTVCGKEWFTKDMNNPNDEDQRKVFFGRTKHIHRLGDGRKIDSIHSTKIPGII